MTETTCIIKTIGRPTLKNAIASARSEGFKPVVISDGVNTAAQGAAQFVKLGKQWGMYGGMCANVAAAIAPTEFITFLDDDDMFIPGAGNVIRNKLKENPDVDIWIGGVRFNAPIALYDAEGNEVFRGNDLAMDSRRGMGLGNVAMPTYRTSIFAKVPWTDTIPEDLATMSDLYHVRACEAKGFKIDWFCKPGDKPLYHVRPHMAHMARDENMVNGRGV
jgi:hypothetical protein